METALGHPKCSHRDRRTELSTVIDSRLNVRSHTGLPAPRLDRAALLSGTAPHAPRGPQAGAAACSLAPRAAGRHGRPHRQRTQSIQLLRHQAEPVRGSPRIAPHPILCRTGDCLQFTRKETGRRRVPPVAMVSEPASPPRPVLLTQSPCVDGWGPRGLRVLFETNPHTDSAHVRRGLRIRHGFLGVSAGVWPLQAFILTAEAWAHARGSAVGNVISLLVSRARPCCPVEVTSSYVQRLVAASSLPQGPC